MFADNGIFMLNSLNKFVFDKKKSSFNLSEYLLQDLHLGEVDV